MSEPSQTRQLSSEMPQPARQSGWAQLITAAEDRIADFFDRYKYLVLILFSIAYLVGTGYRASRKLFWFDELFTVHIARLPGGLGAIWTALRNGADLNPPLVYALTRFSELAIGQGHLGARLPEIVGFGVFCICLFRFVSTRSSALGGTVAMLFPMTTMAYWYAYEARPHGIVLGCCGLALVCWQAAAARSERRTLWLAGLAAALMTGLLAHAYAVLIFVPIGIGECARLLSRKRADWALWSVIAVSCAPILVVIQLYPRGAAGVFSPDVFPATLRSVLAVYKSDFDPTAVILVGALALIGFGLAMPGDRLTRRGHTQGAPTYEYIALVALMMLPLFAYVLAKVGRAPYLSRYSLSAIAGFAALLGMTMARRPAVALLCVTLLSCQIGADLAVYARSSDTTTEPITSFKLSTRESIFAQRYQLMAAAREKSIPIVILDDLEFAPAFYYAPEDIASRLVYLNWEGDINGLGYASLQRCCNAVANVVPRDEFFSKHDTFLAFGKTTIGQARVDELLRSGATIAVESMRDDHFLLLVSFRPKD